MEKLSTKTKTSVFNAESRTVKLECTSNMSREQWLDLRRRGIGGSDASTVVGLNPYNSRLRLYADKKGLLPDKEDNESMRQGRDFENYVAKRWEEATGKKVQRVNFILYNDKYPWAFANIDRDVVGEKALLECKTTSVYNKSDFANGEIPNNYYVQCQHYLAVTGYERAYLAVLVLNKAFYHFTIERDEKEIEALMQAEKDFWENYIEKDIQPEPDGSDSAQEVLDLIEHDSSTALLYSGSLERYNYAKKMSDEWNKEKEAAKQTILQEMGESERGENDKYKCSYLSVKRTSIDSKRLKKEMPEVYDKYSTESSYRTFRFNIKKEQAK